MLVFIGKPPYKNTEVGVLSRTNLMYGKTENIYVS